jgi:hypothetical protein
MTGLGILQLEEVRIVRRSFVVEVSRVAIFVLFGVAVTVELIVELDITISI